MNNYTLILVNEWYDYRVAGIGVGHEDALIQAREWGFIEDELCNIEEYILSRKAYLKTGICAHASFFIFLRSAAPFALNASTLA